MYQFPIELIPRFTNDFDLLQAILARQIVPANNCNADQGFYLSEPYTVCPDTKRTLPTLDVGDQLIFLSCSVF